MACLITVEDFQQEYHPGSVIKGKLTCTFATQESVEEITIQLIGEENTHWKKIVDRSGTNVEGYVDFTGDNSFLCIQKRLSGQDTFKTGRHEFPFTFQLPKNIPGTFSSDLGAVRYYLRARVHPQLYGDFSDHKVNIIVVSPVTSEDVNPSFLNQFKGRVEKEIPSGMLLSCLPLPANRIIMDVNMQQRVFNQGKTAKVNVLVVNSSDQDIQKVELVIGQVLEYKVDTPEEDVKVKSEIIFHKTKRHKRTRYKARNYNFYVKIPTSTVIPNFRHCKFLSQQCFLQATTFLRDDDKVKLVTQIGIKEDIATTGLRTPVPERRPSSRSHRRRGRTSNASTSPIPSPVPTRIISPRPRHSSTSDSSSSSEDLAVASSMDKDAPPPSYESVCGDLASKEKPRQVAPTQSPSNDPPPFLPVAMPMPALSSPPPYSSLPPPGGGSSLYPPEAAAYPSEEALAKWDNLLSTITNIKPSLTTLCPSTNIGLCLPPLECATGHVYPSFPLPCLGQETPTNAGAGDNSLPEAMLGSSTASRFSNQAGDRLYPPPIDSVRFSEGSVVSLPPNYGTVPGTVENPPRCSGLPRNIIGFSVVDNGELSNDIGKVSSTQTKT